MKRVSLQYYQMVLMDQAFYRRDIPVDEIAWHMHALLPQKYCADQPSGSKREPLDKEQLKKEIILAGTAAYEALIEAAQKSNYQELVKHLTDHSVQQLYRWIWVWNEDNSIMRRGQSWFTTKEECQNEGRRNMPSYTTFDGPGCPVAALAVEAVCSCFVHMADSYEKLIAPPCLCFTPIVPYQFQGLTELEIDGMKISKMPVTNFGFPPHYEYLIKSTGEKFSSHEKDIYRAYLERRRCSIVQSKE